MLAGLINKYKSIRKQAYLNQLNGYKKAYAFIGAGSHSLANLYPCLRQLNVPLHYICTKTQNTASKVAATFPNCTGITDIKTILTDSSIKGVFVCTQPILQQDITRQLLAAGKSVFVEKPPALSSEGLEVLIATQKAAENAPPSYCIPGLQRRFSTIHQLLEKHSFTNATYHYRYLTGAYPEGDPIYDLFIHPVDYAIFLFGSPVDTTIHKAQTYTHTTWYIHLKHGSGVCGTLELSTDFSWSPLQESLVINTEKEILEARYPFRLTGMEKPRSIAGIPMDKVLSRPKVQKIYLDNQGSIPTAANNSLVNQGFFGEIEGFVHLVEQDDEDILPKYNLEGLRSTYAVLDQLKQA
jgi:virulence factor